MKLLDPVVYARHKERIGRMALRLFARQGYAETSMAMIAAACHLQKASLYHYFKSKEDILKELIQWRHTEIHKRISRLPSQLNFEKMLVHIGMGMMEDIRSRENRDFTMLLLRESFCNPLLRRIFETRFNERITQTHSVLYKKYFRGGPKLTRREQVRFMHQFMGCLTRYMIETQMLKSGPAMLFSDREYVGSLAKIFAKGMGV